MVAKISKMQTDLIPDEPLVQDANYALDAQDRQYIDNQIRSMQEYISKGLINGICATYFKVFSDVSKGDVVCFVDNPENNTQIATANAANLNAAGSAVGVALDNFAAGTLAAVAIFGAIPKEITLVQPGPERLARVSSTGRVEAVLVYSNVDYPIGGLSENAILTLTPSAGLGYFGQVPVVIDDLINATPLATPATLCRRGPIDAEAAFGPLESTTLDTSDLATLDSLVVVNAGEIGGDFSVGNDLTVSNNANVVGGLTVIGNIDNSSGEIETSNIIVNGAAQVNVLTVTTSFNVATINCITLNSSSAVNAKNITVNEGALNIIANGNPGEADIYCGRIWGGPPVSVGTNSASLFLSSQISSTVCGAVGLQTATCIGSGGSIGTNTIRGGDHIGGGAAATGGIVQIIGGSIYTAGAIGNGGPVLMKGGNTTSTSVSYRGGHNIHKGGNGSNSALGTQSGAGSLSFVPGKKGSVIAGNWYFGIDLENTPTNTNEGYGNIILVPNTLAPSWGAGTNKAGIFLDPVDKRLKVRDPNGVTQVLKYMSDP